MNCLPCESKQIISTNVIKTYGTQIKHSLKKHNTN